MPDSIAFDVAQTQPGQEPPRIAMNQAVSFLALFKQVEHLLASSPAPKRPNRNHPVSVPAPQSYAEIAAWERASDEALETLESELLE